MVHANILGRLCRIFVRFPVLISTAHNISEGGKIRELAYRVTDFLTDLTTNVSQAATETYRKKKLASPNKIKFIPNGISLSKTIQISNKAKQEYKDEFSIYDETFVWLAVGRLSIQKDYPNLIEAAKIIDKQHKNFKVIIAGEGELRENLYELADKIGISGKVVFAGLRSDINKLMQFCDAYVISSAWEGLPIVLLEAVCAKLPIVATDVGGNREIVKDSINGRLVPPHNSVLLAKAMIEIMNFSEEKIKEYGEAGINKVINKYSIEKIVGQWLKIYIDLLNINSRKEKKLS